MITSQISPQASPVRGKHQYSRSAVSSSFQSLVASSISPAKQASPRRAHADSEEKIRCYDYQQSPQKALDDPFSPVDQMHSPFRVLGEVQNRGPASPSRRQKQGIDKAAVKHKRSMTEVLARLSPKKSFHKQSDETRDKENTTPPSSARGEVCTPIWAQFTSQPLSSQDITRPPMIPASSYQSSPSRPISTRTGSNLSTELPPASPSKVKTAVAALNSKSSPAKGPAPTSTLMQGKELEDAFERVLVARNIPENMRSNMRALDAHVKREFIKNDTPAGALAEDASTAKPSFWARTRGKSSTRGREVDRDDAVLENEAQPTSPNKRGRSRSRGRGFTLGKGDKSPFKKPRSISRPRSLMSLKNLSSSSLNSVNLDGSKESKEAILPDQFARYLREQQRPQDVEIGKIHKLRLLLRNESISWTEAFIAQGGMTTLIGLLERIMRVEWREEHEDVLLHEVLLCLKGLCTTRRAQEKLIEVAPSLFPELLKMLFDEERKGPSEYNTRSIIIHILSTAPLEGRAARAHEILGYLQDPASSEDEQPLGFIAKMHQRRPYQLWCKEVTNVTREVFWIFLHHLNVIPLLPVSTETTSDGGAFARAHFPQERPPVPAAPYVGGVEWEANNYIAQHLDLLNGLVASMPTRTARNDLRAELRDSGFEKLMGSTLRLCKEKFYGAIHDVLRTWVSAAADDGWNIHDVRMGPPKEEDSPSKSPAKRKTEAAPQLELPKLDLGVPRNAFKDDDQWL